MSAEEAALIERFYSAFARRDGDEMAAGYAPDATFSDEVFVDLRGDEVGSMWRMLCSRGEDLKVEHSGVSAEDGSAARTGTPGTRSPPPAARSTTRSTPSFGFATG